MSLGQLMESPLLHQQMCHDQVPVFPRVTNL